MRLREGLPQRLDLRQLELAVPALGTPRHRVAEAPLPAAQRVRADTQHRRGGVRADRAHARQCSPLRELSHNPRKSPCIPVDALREEESAARARRLRLARMDPTPVRGARVGLPGWEVKNNPSNIRIRHPCSAYHRN